MEYNIEINRYGDFDITVSSGVWKGTSELTLDQINKDFFLDYISKSKTISVDVENDKYLDIRIKYLGKINSAQIRFKKGKFYLPHNFPNIQNEYIDYIESIGFKKIELNSITTNSQH